MSLTPTACPSLFTEPSFSKGHALTYQPSLPTTSSMLPADRTRPGVSGTGSFGDRGVSGTVWEFRGQYTQFAEQKGAKRGRVQIHFGTGKIENDSSLIPSPPVPETGYAVLFIRIILDLHQLSEIPHRRAETLFYHPVQPTIGLICVRQAALDAGDQAAQGTGDGDAVSSRRLACRAIVTEPNRPRSISNCPMAAKFEMTVVLTMTVTAGSGWTRAIPPPRRGLHRCHPVPDAEQHPFPARHLSSAPN